jgi:hypothetical protein
MPAFAVVIDVPASWEVYRRVQDDLGEVVPDGLLVHSAGPTESGFRIVDVWASRDAFESFQRDRLGPVVARHIDPERVTPTFQGLRAEHLLHPPLETVSAA